MLRIGRTLPPAASPLTFRNLMSGIRALFAGSVELERRQQELQTYFGTKHCFLVSSGKGALALILQALRGLHPDRDQVLIPAFACYSVPSAITRAGLQVQLCDIDLTTLDFDYGQLENKLANPRLLCVLPIHLFGLPADIDRLKQLRRDPAVCIVEDAAQAMGGEWQGKKLGTWGEVGFFSLGRGKALTAVEGGVIITDDDGLARAFARHTAALPECSPGTIVKQIASALALMLLLRPGIFWLPKAMPFLRLGETRYDPHFPMRRFSAFQAGLLAGMEKKLDQLRRTRREHTCFWLKNLSSSIVEKKTAMTSKSEHQDPPDLLRFPVQMPNRQAVDQLLAASEQAGLGLARTYPDAIHGIAQLANQFADQTFPNARRATQELITLPVHGFLTANDRKQLLQLCAHQCQEAQPNCHTSNC